MIIFLFQRAALPHQTRICPITTIIVLCWGLIMKFGCGRVPSIKSPIDSLGRPFLGMAYGDEAEEVAKGKLYTYGPIGEPSAERATVARVVW